MIYFIHVVAVMAALVVHLNAVEAQPVGTEAGTRTYKAEWTSLTGPDRNYCSRETGLLKQWPEDGPKLLWKTDQVGQSWVTAIVGEDRLYTCGYNQERRRTDLIAFTIEGQELWRAPYAGGQSWGGVAATPTFYKGNIHLIEVLGKQGIGILCLDATTGKEVWRARPDPAQHPAVGPGAQYGPVGGAQSVLVDDRCVYAYFGLKGGDVWAFDRLTGKVVWQNGDIQEGNSHPSAIFIERGGRRLYVNNANTNVVAIDTRDGKLVWKEPWVNAQGRTDTINSPVYEDGLLYLQNGYRAIIASGRPKGALDSAGVMYRMSVDGNSLRQLWWGPHVANFFQGAVLHDGKLFGSGGGGFNCVDAQTGRVLGTRKGLGAQQVCWADGMIYGVSHAGPGKDVRVTLLTADDKLELRGSFAVPGDGKTDPATGKETGSWVCSFPVVAYGRLFVRHMAYLYVFDIRAEVRRP